MATRPTNQIFLGILAVLLLGIFAVACGTSQAAESESSSVLDFAKSDPFPTAEELTKRGVWIDPSRDFDWGWGEYKRDSENRFLAFDGGFVNEHAIAAQIALALPGTGIGDHRYQIIFAGDEQLIEDITRMRETFAEERVRTTTTLIQPDPYAAKPQFLEETVEGVKRTNFAFSTVATIMLEGEKSGTARLKLRARVLLNGRYGPCCKITEVRGTP